MQLALKMVGSSMISRCMTHFFGPNPKQVPVSILLSAVGKGLFVMTVQCQLLSHVLSGIPQTVALQAPLSMGFSRREYWSGLPFPFPGVLTQGSPALQADSLLSELQGSPLVMTCSQQIGSSTLTSICTRDLDFEQAGLMPSC